MGARAFEETGYSLTPIGDVNGDGREDFVVASRQEVFQPTRHRRADDSCTDPVVFSTLATESGVRLEGSWHERNCSQVYCPPYFQGDRYLSDGNTSKGSKLILWQIELAQSGTYEVGMSFVAGPEQATNAKVSLQTVSHGQVTVFINQRRAAADDVTDFESLGTFEFNTNQFLVLLSNDGTDGEVTVDALRFRCLPVKTSERSVFIPTSQSSLLTNNNSLLPSEARLSSSTFPTRIPISASSLWMSASATLMSSVAPRPPSAMPSASAVPYSSVSSTVTNLAPPPVTVLLGSPGPFAYVIFGRKSPFPPMLNLSSIMGGNGFVIAGLGTTRTLGFSAARLGDVNGDGAADFAVGVPGSDFERGRLYIIFGRKQNESAFSAVLDVNTLEGTNGFTVINSGNISSRLGISAIGLHDWNQDGARDIAFGAGKQVSVLFGQAVYSAFYDIAALPLTHGITITGPSDHFGWGLVALDFNGDGVEDVAVGDPSFEQGGGVFVIFGNASPRSLQLSSVSYDGGIIIRGGAPGARMGASLAAGDVNGDGFSDLLVGSPLASFADRVQAGQVSVLYGSTSWQKDVSLDSLTTVEGHHWGGADFAERAGTAIFVSHSLDGDGISEVLIGAPGASRDGRNWGGVLYVVRGGQSESQALYSDLGQLETQGRGTEIAGQQENDLTGQSVAAMDVDGDGSQDILLGSPGASPNGVERAGITYIIRATEALPTTSTPSTTMSVRNRVTTTTAEAITSPGLPLHTTELTDDSTKEATITKPSTTTTTSPATAATTTTSTAVSSSMQAHTSDSAGSTSAIEVPTTEVRAMTTTLTVSLDTTTKSTATASTSTTVASSTPNRATEHKTIDYQTTENTGVTDTETTESTATTGTQVTTAVSSGCVPTEYFSAQDQRCLSLRSCFPYEYVAIQPTATTDRICTNCSMSCPPGMRTERPCGTSSDLKCEGCSTCAARLEFALTACSGEKNTVCAPCARCNPETHFEARPCFATFDTLCLNHTVCSAFEFELRPPTTVSDRICATLAMCDNVSFESRLPTPTTDRLCLRHTQCLQEVEYETRSPSNTSDRRCVTTSICADQEYEHRPPSLTSDRKCTSLTACLATDYVYEVPTATSDRKCRSCGTCQFGLERIQQICTNESKTECVPCSQCEPSTFAQRPCQGFEDTDCIPWSQCNFSSEYEARPGSAIRDRECLLLTSCKSGEEYQTRPPTSTSDRRCVILSTCSDLEYEQRPATSTSDRRCRSFVECKPDEYELKPVNPTSDRQCQAVSACLLQEYEMAAPSATTDRECADITICTDENYASIPATATSNAVCHLCTECPVGHHETAQCTPTSNRECFGCRVCSELGYFQASPCLEEQDAVCQQCKSCNVADEYQALPCHGANNTLCLPFTTCNTSQFEVRSPTPFNDRVCALLAECGQEEYQTRSPSPTTDRACQSLRVCTEAEYQIRVPTLTSDRRCMPLNDCLSDEFISSQPTATSNRACDRIIPCDFRKTYEVAAATPTSNTICAAVRTCDSTQYEQRAASLSTDRICASLTICPLRTSFIAVPATPTSDRSCSLAAPVCREDIEFQRLPLTVTSDRLCQIVQVCNKSSYEVSPPSSTTDRICLKARVCDAISEHEATPMTTTSDRQCQSNAICGIYQHQIQAPTATSNRQCQSNTVCHLLDAVLAEPSATTDRFCSCFPSTNVNLTSSIELEGINVDRLMQLTEVQMQEEIQLVERSIFEAYVEIVAHALRNGQLPLLPDPQPRSLEEFLATTVAPISEIDKYLRRCSVNIISIRPAGNGDQRRAVGLLYPRSVVEYRLSQPTSVDLAASSCLYHVAGSNGNILSRLRAGSRLYDGVELKQGAIASPSGCTCGCAKGDDNEIIVWVIPVVVGLLLFFVLMSLVLYRARRHKAVKAPFAAYMQPPKRLPAYIAPPTFEESVKDPFIKPPGPPKSSWTLPKAPPYKPPPAYPGREHSLQHGKSVSVPKSTPPPSYLKALQLKTLQPHLRDRDPRPFVYETLPPVSPTLLKSRCDANLRRAAPVYEEPPVFHWDQPVFVGSSPPTPHYEEPPDFSVVSADSRDLDDTFLPQTRNDDFDQLRPTPEYEEPPPIDFDDDNNNDNNGNSFDCQHSSSFLPSALPYTLIPGSRDEPSDDDDDKTIMSSARRALPSYVPPPGLVEQQTSDSEFLDSSSGLAINPIYRSALELNKR